MPSSAAEKKEDVGSQDKGEQQALHGQGSHYV